MMKFASLLIAAVMLISCGDKTGNDSVSSELKIEPDKTLVQSDGEDFVTLNVTLNGVPVTDGVVFYEGSTKLDVVDFKFFTTVAGDHKIWANYGSYISDPVTVRAISIPIPPTPEDPAPERADFKSRVMVMQFTGTACGYCSQFMDRLKDAFDDAVFADEYVKAAIHNYQYSSAYPDKAYLAWDWASSTLGAMNPSIIMDYKSLYALYASTSSDEFKSEVRKQNDSKKADACGIAVNAKLVDGQVVAKVTVKAAKTGTYRVGGILLEDGIKGKQINGKEWMNTHNACVRHIDAKVKVASREGYYGHSLGEIKAGETADYLFVWNLADVQKENDPNYYWDNFVVDNLRMAVFVTGSDGYINNAVKAEFGVELPFEYKN